MDWETWKPWYLNIRRALKLNISKDESAAKLLDQLLSSYDVKIPLDKAKNLVSNKIVFVYGCGPSLIKNIENLLEINIFENEIVNIAVDGAISALIEKGITPHISVTDLDGNIEDLIRANSESTIAFIHAHGDNGRLLKKFVHKFKNVIGTTQTRPYGKIKNFGGFTDGDRAIFIAEFLNAKAIFLVGFDFGTIVGKYSKPELKEDSNVLTKWMSQAYGGWHRNLDINRVNKAIDYEENFPEWLNDQKHIESILIDEIMTINLTDSIDEISTPLLCIAGKEDTDAPWTIIKDELENYGGDKTFKLFEKSHHMVFIDEEDLFVETIVHFFKTK